MRAGLIKALIGTTVGIAYWSAFTAASGTREPWDGEYYWSVAYPVSVIVSAALGFAFRRSAWIGGLALTFAQWPIMAVGTGIGPLSLPGIAFLGVLSVPPMIAATMAGARNRNGR